MKGLTLWQPWASLIGRGKHYETRSWSTKYRGPIAIHAALRKPVTSELTEQTKIIVEKTFGNEWISNIPLGEIIAVAHITDCKPTETIDTDPINKLLGNYSHGRWAWELSDIIILSKPLPFKGSHKLWNVPDEIKKKIIL